MSHENKYTPTMKSLEIDPIPVNAEVPKIDLQGDVILDSW